MKPAPNFLAALVLALAFLLGQHAAALHALGHASEELEHASHDSDRPPKACEDHALFAAVGNAVAAQAPVAPFIASASPNDRAEAIRSASLPQRFFFHSRAPPVSPA